MARRGWSEPSARPGRGDGPDGPRAWDRRDAVMAALVALASLVAFLPVLANGFAEHWDDDLNFLDNRSFRGLGWPQLRWAWTTTLLGVYQPLAWMLFEVEYAGWGMEPLGFHLASLILHASVAVLFFALTRALVARAMHDVPISPGRAVIPPMSGLAAMVFAVHPLRVEVVAWASCQPYLPCAATALLSVLAYVRSRDEGAVHRGWRCVSVLLYVLSLGFHAIPLGLPLVLLILDRSVLRRAATGSSLRALVIEKVPYLIPAIAASAMAIHAKEALHTPEAERVGLARMAAERVGAAGYGFVYYLEKTAWPSHLSAYHFRPDPLEPASRPIALRLAAAAAIGAAAYGLRRRAPGIPSALLAYAILAAPHLGFLPFGLMLVADRYAYIATMPLFLAAAGGLVRLVAMARRPGSSPRSSWSAAWA